MNIFDIISKKEEILTITKIFSIFQKLGIIPVYTKKEIMQRNDIENIIKDNFSFGNHSNIVSSEKINLNKENFVLIFKV